MKKITKIFFTALLVISHILFFSVPLVSAVWVDNLPTPTEAMDEILDNLGVDKDELMYGIRTMNVARRKRQPPQVSLSFSPTDPKEGQAVTAVASPTYFLNDTKDLYLTWYLKTPGCAKDPKPSSEKRKRCDLNDDNRVDWKIGK